MAGNASSASKWPTATDIRMMEGLGKKPEKKATILRPLLIRPDERGSVREAYRASWFPGVPPVVQVVHSESHATVMRAMHAHHRQYDIWHFTAGRAFVQTFGIETDEHFAFEVGPEDTLVIPPGVAHGFIALTNVTLTYYLTEEYDGSDEDGFDAWDPFFPGATLWPQPAYFYVRSERDRTAQSYGQFLENWRK